jgi:hypothetical protein
MQDRAGDQRDLAWKEGGDQVTVLRPGIRIMAMLRVEPEVAGVPQVVTERAQPIQEAAPAELARSRCHADVIVGGQLAAERGRDTDDGDGSVHGRDDAP